MSIIKAIYTNGNEKQFNPTHFFSNAGWYCLRDNLMDVFFEQNLTQLEYKMRGYTYHYIFKNVKPIDTTFSQPIPANEPMFEGPVLAMTKAKNSNIVKCQPTGLTRKWTVKEIFDFISKAEMNSM